MAARLAICSAVSSETAVFNQHLSPMVKLQCQLIRRTYKGRQKPNLRIGGTGEKLQSFLGAFGNSFSTGDAHHREPNTVFR